MSASEQEEEWATDDEDRGECVCDKVLEAHASMRHVHTRLTHTAHTHTAGHAPTCVPCTRNSACGAMARSSRVFIV